MNLAEPKQADRPLLGDIYTPAGVALWKELEALLDTNGHDNRRAAHLGLLLYAAQLGASDAVRHHVELHRGDYPDYPTLAEIWRTDVIPANATHANDLRGSG